MEILLMKKYINKYLKKSILLTNLACFTACDSSQEKTNEHLNSYSLEQFSKAALPLGIMVEDIPSTSISVLEARKQNNIGKKLIVTGFIGGRKDPFSANRASFILGDNKIKTCDKILDDNCPTPWDACCEDRKKILDGTMNIQIVDDNNSLIQGNLNGVGTLKPGLQVKVLGIVDVKSLPEAMVLNAKQIQVL